MINENKDLIWDLSKIENKSDAINFISQFNGIIPVYSRALKQLYFDYEIKPYKDGISIHPNFTISDSYFANFPDVFIKTNSYILPGEAVNKSDMGTILMYKLKNNNKFKTEPGSTGIKKVIEGYFKYGVIFLPIMRRESLNDIVDGYEYSINLFRFPFEKNIEDISKLTKNNVRSSIIENTRKLITLFEDMEK